MHWRELGSDCQIRLSYAKPAPSTHLLRSLNHLAMRQECPCKHNPRTTRTRPAVSKASPSSVRLAGLFLTKGPIVSTPPQRFSAEFYDTGKAVVVLSGLRRLTGDFQSFAINESIGAKYSAQLIKPDSIRPQLGADAKGFAVFSDETGTKLECSYTFTKSTGRGQGVCADNQ